MRVAGAGEILRRLVDTVAKGGTYLLNISPQADGIIPGEQRATLVGIGRWLAINGEAIYATRPWRTFGEDGVDGVRFTTKHRRLYAIVLAPPAPRLTIKALGRPAGRVTRVELVGRPGALAFSQNAGGLTIVLPPLPADDAPYGMSFRIDGVL